MKRILLMLAGAVLAGPAAAADVWDGLPPATSPVYASTSLYTGHIELGFAIAKNDDITIKQFDATGRLAGPLGTWLKGEVEALGIYYTADGYSASGGGVVGHLYKEEGNYALGVAAGVLSIDSATSYGIGLEGKAYLGPNVLTGQVAYVDGEDDSDYFAVAGQFDHYFTPDLKGLAGLSFMDGTNDDRTIWLASLGVEKRITGTRLSLFASGSYMNVSDGSSADIWAARVGARVFFDQPTATLEQHDRQVPFAANWLTGWR